MNNYLSIYLFSVTVSKIFWNCWTDNGWFSIGSLYKSLSLYIERRHMYPWFKPSKLGYSAILGGECWICSRKFVGLEMSSNLRSLAIITKIFKGLILKCLSMVSSFMGCSEKHRWGRKWWLLSVQIWQIHKQLFP